MTIQHCFDVLFNALGKPLTFSILGLVIVFVGWYLFDTGYGRSDPLNHPRRVRSLIPWIGFGISFARDNHGLISWLRDKMPQDKIVAITMAGKTIYMVFDTDLGSQIYRQSRSFAFDPLALYVLGLLGSNKGDIELLRDGHHSPSNGLATEKDKSRETLLMFQHRLTTSELKGESLHVMTDIFLQTLTKDLQKRFVSNEWEELDLIQFMRHYWTLASSASLFGTKILELEGEEKIVDWLWGFDTKFAGLAGGVPDWMVPAAAKRREEGLGIFSRWEAAAWAAENRGEGLKEGEVWNEWWGLRYTRDRTESSVQYGVSERGRAGSSLSLFWALNSNAIPVATSLTTHLLSSPSLLAKAVQEIKSCTTFPSSSTPFINIAPLLQKPYLNSLLQETLRMNTASPGVRVVRENTQVGEYTLKKGGLVMIHARTLQMNPDVWGSDSGQFRGDRFVDTVEENGEENRAEEAAEAESNYQGFQFPTPPKSSSQSQMGKEQAVKEEREKKKEDREVKKRRDLSMRAFGGGQSLCPGRFFASNEILGGVAVLLGVCEVEVVGEGANGEAGVDLEGNKLGGLWPGKGLRVRVRRRRD